MSARVIAETRAWVERAVIGLRLCPFAAAPHARGQVRYVVSSARTPRALLADLARELERLVATPPEQVETTLLIHPQALNDFLAYNDFLAVADRTIAKLGLEGTIQIASFHPAYRFAEADPDDVANATNRSPHPMLQLLREASVERAVAGLARPDAVFENNIATMRRLGAAGWADLQSRWRADVADELGSGSDTGEDEPA